MSRAMATGSPSLEALRTDPRILWTDDVLRFRDTDRNGHVNNSVFSVLCESGRVHLFREHIDPGLPPGHFFVIVRLNIEFRAELHYPGAVRTGTWVTRVGRTSITLEQALVCGTRVAATAEGVCVLLDGASRRPAALPEEAQRGASAFMRHAPPETPRP